VVARLEFEPAEGEPLCHVAQLGDAVLVYAGEGVALGTGLVAATDVRSSHLGELPLGVFSERIESLVERGDIALLVLKIVFDHAGTPRFFRPSSLRPLLRGRVQPAKARRDSTIEASRRASSATAASRIRPSTIRLRVKASLVESRVKV